MAGQSVFEMVLLATVTPSARRTAIPARDLPHNLGDVSFTVTELDPLSMRVSMIKDDETLSVAVEDGFARIATERMPAEHGTPAF